MNRKDMRIGMVSAEKHCGVHLQRLADLGYAVTLLGDGPTVIPPSINVVIVRVDSCSHTGTSTANDWRRNTKQPCIFESGMSGMLRELKKLESTTVPDRIFRLRSFAEVQSVFGDKYREAAFKRAYDFVEHYITHATPEKVREVQKAFSERNFLVFRELDAMLGGQLLSSQITYTVFLAMVVYPEGVPYKKNKIKSFFQEIRNVQYNTQMVDVVSYWFNAPAPEVSRPSHNRVLPTLTEMNDPPEVSVLPEANVSDPDIEPLPPKVPQVPEASTDLKALIDDNATQVLECMNQVGSLMAEIESLKAKMAMISTAPPPPAPSMSQDSVVAAKNLIKRYLRSVGVVGPITIQIDE